MENYASLFSGLGILLLGTKLSGKAFYRISSLKQRSFFTKITKFKIHQIIIGIILGFSTGNSMAAMIIIMAALSGKLLSLNKSAGIILGANFGSVLGYYCFKNAVFLIMPSAIILGIFLELISNRKKLKNFSKTLIGLGTVYLGLNILAIRSSFFSGNFLLAEITNKSKNPFVSYLTGISGGLHIFDFGGVLQSANKLFLKDAIDYKNLISFLIGINTAKTVVPLIASLELNQSAKKGAILNILFNFLSGIVILILINYFKNFIFGMDLAFNRKIILILLIINALNIAIQYLFTDFFLYFIRNILWRNGDFEEFTSKYPDESLISDKNKSIAALKNECVNIFDIVRNNLILIKDVYFTGSFFLNDKIEENEKMIDILSKDISDFAIKAAKSNGKNFSKEFSAYIYIASDIEKIGDHIVEILKTCFGYMESGEFFEYKTFELEALFTLTLESINKTQKLLIENRYEIYEEIFRMEKNFENLRIKISDAIFQNDWKDQKLNQSVLILDSVQDLLSIYGHCKKIADNIIKI